MNYSYEQYKKNMEILSGFEKVAKEIDSEKQVSFEIKDRDGNLTKVSKEEFAWWMVNEKNNDSWVGDVFSLEPEIFETEKQKNKLTEESMKDDKKSIENPKKSLNHHFIDSDNNSIYSVEEESKDIAIKETYHEPRNKKEQIIEQNEAQREKEEKQKSQFENSENKSTGAEKSIQSDKNQELVKDKNNDFSLTTKIAIGGGIILTPILLVVIVNKWKNK